MLTTQNGRIAVFEHNSGSLGRTILSQTSIMRTLFLAQLLLVGIIISGCEVPSLIGPEEESVFPPQVTMSHGIIGPGDDAEDEWYATEHLRQIETAITTMMPGPPVVPTFSMVTQLSDPMPLVTYKKVRHDRLAQYTIDGTDGPVAFTGGQFTLAPGGTHSAVYDLPFINCEKIEESASWNIDGYHYGEWAHYSIPILSSPLKYPRPGLRSGSVGRIFERC